MSVDVKQCRACKLTKPHSEFTRQSSSPDGLRTYCRTCIVSRNQTYYASHRAKPLSYSALARPDKANRPENLRTSVTRSRLLEAERRQISEASRKLTRKSYRERTKIACPIPQCTNKMCSSSKTCNAHKGLKRFYPQVPVSLFVELKKVGTEHRKQYASTYQTILLTQSRTNHRAHSYPGHSSTTRIGG